MGKVKTSKKGIYALRIMLTLLCALVLAWIFSNSLAVGEKSSSQSGAVTDAVQDVAGVIAPESNIATATGEDYDKLHMDIRTLAHFCEFVALGGLLLFCYFSYTRKKDFFIIPVWLVLFVPLIDECLQTFTGGRAAQLSDVFIDTIGGLVGMALAWIAFLIGKWWYLRRQRRGRASARKGCMDF